MARDNNQPVGFSERTDSVQFEKGQVNPKVRNSLRETILAQRKFYPEIKIFSEWEFLEKIFDNEKSKEPAYRHQIYTYLGFAAVDWFHEFVELKSVNMEYFKINKESKAGIRKTYRGIIGTDRMRQRFTSLFLEILITYIRDEGALEHTKGATPNKVLYDYVAAFFKDEKQKKMTEIKELEEKKELLLKQFANDSVT